MSFLAWTTFLVLETAALPVAPAVSVSSPEALGITAPDMVAVEVPQAADLAPFPDAATSEMTSDMSSTKSPRRAMMRSQSLDAHLEQPKHHSAPMAVTINAVGIASPAGIVPDQADAAEAAATPTALPLASDLLAERTGVVVGQRAPHENNSTSEHHIPEHVLEPASGRTKALGTTEGINGKGKEIALSRDNSTSNALGTLAAEKPGESTLATEPSSLSVGKPGTGGTAQVNGSSTGAKKAKPVNGSVYRGEAADSTLEGHADRDLHAHNSSGGANSTPAMPANKSAVGNATAMLPESKSSTPHEANQTSEESETLDDIGQALGSILHEVVRRDKEVHHHKGVLENWYDEWLTELKQESPSDANGTMSQASSLTQAGPADYPRSHEAGGGGGELAAPVGQRAPTYAEGGAKATAAPAGSMGRPIVAPQPRALATAAIEAIGAPDPSAAAGFQPERQASSPSVNFEPSEKPSASGRQPVAGFQPDKPIESPGQSPALAREESQEAREETLEKEEHAKRALAEKKALQKEEERREERKFIVICLGMLLPLTALVIAVNIFGQKPVAA